MHAVGDWHQFQERLASVPRISPSYTTNLFAARDQVDRWCAAGRLHALAADDAILFLLAERDFKRVYHAAADYDALAAALRLLDPGVYTADLIGEEGQLAPVLGAYAAGGFREYSYLRRMTRVQAPAESSPGGAICASPQDAPLVAAFLERLLDRFVEQLPSVEELRDAAAAEQLLIAKRGPDLAGMLMYDLRGQSAHLRFWHVDDNARGEGVGRGLMTSFLSRCAGARRIILWVIGDNARSASIYRHYGFTDDALVDRVMIMHKEGR